MQTFLSWLGTILRFSATHSSQRMQPGTTFVFTLGEILLLRTPSMRGGVFAGSFTKNRPLSPARSLQPENSAMLGLCCGCSSARSTRLSTLTEQCTYLCYCFLVPHGRLFDQVADFYIPISTRNDHPGPPETHRHFHFSFTATLIPIRRKARRSD